VIPPMHNIKKIGTVGYWDVGRDDEGDVCLLLDVDNPNSTPFYLSVAGSYTLDERLAEIRAACTDPREAVIAAARAFIAAEGADDVTFEALVSAVERLEETECDDDEA